jgi:hypothetical protein
VVQEEPLMPQVQVRVEEELLLLKQLVREELPLRTAAHHRPSTAQALLLQDRGLLQIPGRHIAALHEAIPPVTTIQE